MLVRQRDYRQRKKMVFRYMVVLTLVFLAHTYFSNLSTPLKLIPQTLAAITMGYIVILIISVRQFTHISEFIDWTKVNTAAEPDSDGNAEKPPGVEREP